MGDDLFGASRSSTAQVSSANERPSYLEKYTDEFSAMHNYSDSDDSGSENEQEKEEARKSGLAFEKEERFRKSNMDFGDVIENEMEDDAFQSDNTN